MHGGRAASHISTVRRLKICRSKYEIRRIAMMMDSRRAHATEPRRRDVLFRASEEGEHWKDIISESRWNSRASSQKRTYTGHKDIED